MSSTVNTIYSSHAVSKMATLRCRPFLGPPISPVPKYLSLLLRKRRTKAMMATIEYMRTLSSKPSACTTSTESWEHGHKTGIFHYFLVVSREIIRNATIVPKRISCSFCCSCCLRDTFYIERMLGTSSQWLGLSTGKPRNFRPETGIEWEQNNNFSWSITNT